MKKEEIQIVTLAAGTDLKKLNISSQYDIIFDATDIAVSRLFVAAYNRLLEQIKSDNYSRVLVVDSSYLSLFTDADAVVPTLGEAHDLIEMERIERDLGF